ncbi:MAG: hypothetical protein PHE50_00215 [Dehalococcoidales bacterium]|nr:hypothetical protein [Dehalococcoidales bacterium]
MGLIFKPNGILDIATAATDLPAQRSDKMPDNVYSEALTRCKNLRIDRKGLLTVRDGSSKINATAFASNVELVTNGTFTTDISGWTDSSAGGSISWDAGTMLLNSTSGNAIADQAISITTINVAHTLTFDLTISGNSPIFVSIGTVAGLVDIYGPTTYSISGSYSASFTPTASTVYLRFTKTTGAVNINLDTVSIKRDVDPVNLLIEQAGNRYAFAGPQIFRNEISIVSGLTDAQWSGIKYNAFNDTTQQIYALNGTDRKRIEGSTVYEWGIAAPGAGPTVGVGTGTGLTGSYLSKITYARKVGSVVVSESNPSSASSSQSLANQALRVTWAASSDAQVTHVRVYRTTANGSIYYHDQDVAIGSVTVDTTTADSSLGSQVETDHDRPPLGTVVSGPAFDGTCFIIYNNNLYFCKPKQPDYWPALYFVEVSTVQFPGQTLVFHNGQLHYLSTNDIYLIQGTGAGSFLPIKQNSKTGAQGVFGAVSVKGKGIIHTGKDGIYLYSGTDQKITELTLEPLFRGETVNGMPGVSNMTTAWLHVFGNNLYFGYTSSGYTYPTNILVINLDTNRTSYYVYNDGSVVSIRCLTTDETNNRLIVGDTIGFIRKIEDKSQTTDSSSAIAWEVQSMDYTLQTRRHFPRYAKYDVDASAATTCTGAIIVDGTTVQSHTLSGVRDTGYRHIETSNGRRCALKISGTGPATVYASELE